MQDMIHLFLKPKETKRVQNTFTGGKKEEDSVGYLLAKFKGTKLANFVFKDASLLDRAKRQNEVMALGQRLNCAWKVRRRIWLWGTAPPLHKDGPRSNPKHFHLKVFKWKLIRKNPA